MTSRRGTACDLDVINGLYVSRIWPVYEYKLTCEKAVFNDRFETPQGPPRWIVLLSKRDEESPGFRVIATLTNPV